MSATLAYLLFLDMILPATLYFYGHTIHIKSQTELDVINPPKIEPEIDYSKVDSIQMPKVIQDGDKVILSIEGFPDREVRIKVPEPEVVTTTSGTEE
jgi:hypothetical protein